MSRTHSQTAKATESEAASDDKDVLATQSHAPEESTAKKTSAKKTTTRKKAAPAKKKRLTLKDMQADLKSLETRLKRANTLTRKSVKTLEDVVENLDARSRKDNAAQKSALSSRVSDLSHKLETGLSTTQAEIKSTLAIALSNPNPDAVQAALHIATTRLQDQERQQAQAVAKINRHLANLAKAVEDRIIKDQVKASEALRAVEQRFSKRLDIIETDSAEAIQTIGEKVSTLNAEIQRRNTREDAELAEKIAEMREQAQAQSRNEINTVTQSLTARIERLEGIETDDVEDTTDTGLSEEIAALSEQLSILQSRLDTMDANVEALQTQSEIMGQEILTTKGDVDTIMAQPVAPSTPAQPHNNAAPQVPAPDNIVTFTPTAPAGVGVAAYNPYLNAPLNTPAASGGQALATSSALSTHFTDLPDDTQNNDAQNNENVDEADYLLTEALDESTLAPETDNAEAPNSGIVEYQPEAFTPQQTPGMAFIPHQQGQAGQASIAPPPTLMGGINPMGQLNPTVEHNVSAPSQAPLNYTDVDSLPAGDPMIPYADPAYAEETMDAARVGGSEKKRRKARKVKKAKAPKVPKGDKAPLLTGRNVRVAAMATGLTLIGLFAAKSILFSSDDPLSSSINAENSYESSSERGSAPINRGRPDTANNLASITDTAAPTIGVYADNQSIPVTNDQASTLQSAADNGDAIAQFQLGLAKLEQNQTEDGVKLIRSAAQTLPAAQYRLAKIYEAGQGVEKNTLMAKDLTERAARAGNRIAMHDLAIYYAYGNGGVDVDMSMAAGWFEKAAERGVVDSQFNLAILFENGQGLRPSQSDAYFWYTVAASQGDQAAKARLQALDAIMTPTDIAAATERAETFTPVKINQAANGIFRNLPWNKAKQTREATARTAQIKQVQELLSNIGFEVGAPDGIMGSKTRAAITKFERSNGMAETGQVTSALIDKLSVAAGA